ncbi:PREDICTED: uncharacterized protein LOC105566686 isoform X2 [Vollenhovia emeryi]|uniref:uncharacterized protein LOC105566686 isoform X2 n=1 Tax=Vollenhovia emeryi TaxID=411798 RepID=UPI0005F3610A|nr:PREDICTED: uncharacterized protein LOC105566686 isoform X2 [Vollenhovia emeryi]
MTGTLPLVRVFRGMARFKNVRTVPFQMQWHRDGYVALVEGCLAVMDVAVAPRGGGLSTILGRIAFEDHS